MPDSSSSPIRVGVISDTHGLIRPEALAALEGSDLIIHAGDIGSPHVLTSLEGIAPVRAIRGNVDTEPWAQTYPETLAVPVGDLCLWILHDRNELDLDPETAGFAAVIFGHSHKPLIETIDGVLYLNPGSAGPRRFRLPISVALLDVQGEHLKPRLIELAV